MQEKLSLRSKLSFGIGAFGKDMVYAIVSTFFMKYLTDYRLVDPLFVAVLFAAVAILFTAPLGSLAIDLLFRKTKYSGRKSLPAQLRLIARQKKRRTARRSERTVTVSVKRSRDPTTRLFRIRTARQEKNPLTEKALTWQTEKIGKSLRFCKIYRL